MANPLCNFASRLRCSMYRAYKKTGIQKKSKTFSLLGYSPTELFHHLRKFVNKPCKECGSPLAEFNKHLDHIIPIGSARTQEDIVRLNQLDNLRFICGYCNLKKIVNDLVIIKISKGKQK